VSDAAAERTEPTSEQQQKLLATGQLFETLAADPKYRKRVLGLIKEVNPNAVIPELDVDDAVERGVTERVKPVVDENAVLRKELDEVKRTLSRDKFAVSVGLTEDELVEVEALAKEAGITKGETAVEHWRMKTQLGTPRSTPQVKQGEEYVAKLRKVKPTDTVRLKQLAIEEGTRILRETRGRRAG
jgi:hypothetical protein